MVRECGFCCGTGEIEVLDPRWLREVREGAGVSVREMARRLGHSAPYVSDVERGKRNVPRDWLAIYRRLAK